MEVAVDIGGTFTDVVGRDGADSWAAKVPSRPGDFAGGVVTGIETVFRVSGRSGADVRRFVHGTTVATNALLEGKGAQLGLLATEGFEDVLEIGRQKRSRMYDLMMGPETPAYLAPGRRRVGIPERIDAEGRVLRPLDEAAVSAAVQRLVAEEGVESVAVCYLFSFRNSAHEQRTRDLVETAFPGLRVSLSCEVDPVFREYERTCVTAFDGYVRPIMTRYLEGLEQRLAEVGVRMPVLMMQSRGGIASARRVAERPVTTLLSGPAAGALGGARAGCRCGRGDVITLDMGGTSCDVAIARDGRLDTTREARIRGFPLRVPTVDLHTIGAGGGSIARVDPAGGLKVGPESAGAEPGPACYDRGGNAPTVTDASVVLGYLCAENFAGGLSLDPGAAHRAIGTLARDLGIDPADAAHGVHTVCNEAMAEAVRMLTVRRGRDPRNFALVLLGGAGPVHGGAVAESLGIGTLVVPARPGVLAAEGLLAARVESEAYRTLALRASDVEALTLGTEFGSLESTARAGLAADGFQGGVVTVRWLADMRYLGQSYDIEVEIEGPADEGLVGRAADAFRRRYREIHGHESLVDGLEFVNLRAVASAPAAAPGAPREEAPPRAPSPREARATRRRAYFGPTHGWLDTPVYRRHELATGTELEGPVILDQADTTTVVQPDHRLEVARAGNLLVHIGP